MDKLRRKVAFRFLVARRFSVKSKGRKNIRRL